MGHDFGKQRLLLKWGRRASLFESLWSWSGVLRSWGSAGAIFISSLLASAQCGRLADTVGRQDGGESEFPLGGEHLELSWSFVASWAGPTPSCFSAPDPRKYVWVWRKVWDTDSLKPFYAGMQCQLPLCVLEFCHQTGCLTLKLLAFGKVAMELWGSTGLAP